MKILAITVSYTAGDNDYNIDKRELSTEAAIIEITKKAKNGLLNPNSVEDSSTISFTIYTTENGNVFPFFFGIRK